MARKKYWPVNWRIFDGDKSSIVNNPGFLLSMETDQDSPQDGKRKKYYAICLKTRTNIYEFWFKRNEEIGKDEMYYSNGDAPEISSDFKKTIEDTKLELSTRQSLNNNKRVESVVWESEEITYDGFLDWETSHIHAKWHPFEAIVNTRQYTNDKGDRCEDIGIILKFDECEVRATIHSKLLFTHTNFQKDLYKEDIEKCPKDWWFFNSYFITLTNKRTGKSNRLCYLDEKPERFVKEKLLPVIAKLNEGL